MQKNESVTVTIQDMGVNGEGIGRVNGYTLFIKDAVIGDVVEARVTKAKKNYGYARLMNIITPSEHRVKPVCKFARKCGGCQIQEDFPICLAQMQFLSQLVQILPSRRRFTVCFDAAHIYGGQTQPHGQPPEGYSLRHPLLTDKSAECLVHCAYPLSFT